MTRASTAEQNTLSSNIAAASMPAPAPKVRSRDSKGAARVVTLPGWGWNHARRIQEAPIEFCRSLIMEHGPLIKMRIGPANVFLVAEPKHVEQILVTRADHYRKTAQYQSLRPALGEGLLTMDSPPEWVHRLMRQVFDPTNFPKLSDRVQETVRESVELWACPQPLTAQPGAAQPSLNASIEQLSLEIACRLTFGGSGRMTTAALQPSIRALQQWMDKRSMGAVHMPEWLPTPSNRFVKRHTHEIDAILKPLLRQVGPQRATNAENLLELFRGARDEHGSELENARLLAELKGLLLVAQRNIANVLIWSLFTLDRNPQVREHLIEQLREPSPANAKNYARMIAEETMRLYPPVWALARQARKASQIGDVKVPIGATILLPTFLLHRRPDHWDKPDAFQPDRFSAIRKANRHRYAYLPYGAGPNRCMGSSFSTTIVAEALVEIHRHGYWHLSEPHYSEPDLRPGMSLEPNEQFAASFQLHA